MTGVRSAGTTTQEIRSRVGSARDMVGATPQTVAARPMIANIFLIVAHSLQSRVIAQRNRTERERFSSDPPTTRRPVPAPRAFDSARASLLPGAMRSQRESAWPLYNDFAPPPRALHKSGDAPRRHDPP